MTIRDDRKQQTRQTLLDAALKLMGDGRSFVSISLREVTREAGVVPTAFYRHFKNGYNATIQHHLTFLPTKAYCIG